jgi:hypothetical protein
LTGISLDTSHRVGIGRTGKYLGCIAVIGCLVAATRAAAESSASAGLDARATKSTSAVSRRDFALPRLGEQAGMVLIGTALIGVAAAVRRAA